MHDLTRAHIDALKTCIEVADPHDEDDTWEQGQVDLAKDAIRILDRCSAIMGDSTCERPFGHDGLHIDHGKPSMSWV